MPYEGLAQQQQSNFRFVDLDQYPVTIAPSEIKRLRASASVFRKRKVEQTLMALIEQEKVRLYRGSLVYLQARVEREYRLLRLRLDPEERLKLHITMSQVGSRIWTRRHCEIDVMQIVEHLVDSAETRGHPKKYEWDKIERWCRDYIERTGIPKERAQLSSIAATSYSNAHRKDKLPDDRSMNDFVAGLISEY